MRLLKIKSKKTYKGKDGVEHHYNNYQLELDNGRRVAIRCVNTADYVRFDSVAEYVK